MEVEDMKVADRVVDKVVVVADIEVEVDMVEVVEVWACIEVWAMAVHKVPVSGLHHFQV